jgi:hypothetical protein
MGDNYRLSVEKLLLDGSNWVSYQDRFQWALEAKDWQDHLTSTTMTQAYIDLGNVNNVPPPRRWLLDNCTVKQMILSSVPNEVFSNIKRQTHTKDVWDALKAIFEGRSSLISVNLGQRLQSTKCSEDDSIHDHFAKLADMHKQLASMGKTISDTKYTSILMGSLPKSYSQTLSAIAATSKITGTAVMPSVVISLTTDEYDKRTVEGSGPPDEVLAADTCKNKKGKRHNVECDNCHKKGHTKPECWAKDGSNEGRGPKHRGKKGRAKGDEKSGKKAEAASAKQAKPDVEAWAAIEELEDEAPQVPVMAMRSEDNIQCELLDLGASRHMSPFCKSFATYRPIEARPITTANNQVFHAIGMGDLPIKVLNGELSTKIVLRDVLYTPELGLTVVSIGHIVKAGYTVEFDQGCCNIKRKKDGQKIASIPAGASGLYKVDHTLSATFLAIILEEPIDILMLHQRLGHISLDSIQSFVCANAVAGLQVIDDKPSFFCNLCEHAKKTRKPIKKECQSAQVQAFGDEVHIDVWGPLPTLSMGGQQWHSLHHSACVVCAGCGVKSSHWDMASMCMTRPILLTI